MRDLLARRFAPQSLEITDNSEDHLGHAEGEGLLHLSVRISSEEFHGLSMLQRHRLVYEAVGDLAGLKIHSLSIDASCPFDPVDKVPSAKD